MSDSEPEFDPALSDYITDSDSDHFDFPEPKLPIGVKKQIVTRSSLDAFLKRPREGDEVVIRHALCVPDASHLDSSESEGQLLRFTVGKGQVMKGLDLGVVTMRLHEKAKFTLSPKFATHPRGAQVDYPVVYEIELVELIMRLDIFGDGSVLKSVLQRGDDWRKAEQNEVCNLRYKCMLLESSRTLKEVDKLEYAVDSSNVQADGLINSEVLDRIVRSMRRGEVASLSCSASVAYRNETELPDGIAPDAMISCELELRDFLPTSDVSFEKDKTVMMKSLHSRDRWPHCRDGGRCHLKVASVSDGDKNVLAAEKTLEFTIGNGEVCDFLECVAPAMRLHEIARVTCTSADICEEPRLGIVPGRPGLVFEVEVVNYEPGPHEEAKCDQEKIAYVENRKAVAGQLFQSQRYALAACRYLAYYELLGYVDDFRNAKSTQERKDKVNELKKGCMLNRALCLIKIGRHRRALKACNVVLEDDPRNIKALFRRAQSQLALGNSRDALHSVRLVVEMEPQNSEARKLRSEIKAIIKIDDSSATATFSKMCNGLGKLPHPLDVD